VRLADLQAAYRHYLLSGDIDRLAPAIVADAFDGTERLSIYRNNFLLSLTEALKANFPVTLQMLGADFFGQTARRFVLAHPPQRPCLFEYGAAFPDYLRELPELSRLPYVPEMARFEFARIAAYNAPRERYVAAETLSALSPDQLEALPICCARHAQIVWAEAPMLALWTAHQAAEPKLSEIEMTERRHALLVCRPDRTLVVQELDAAAAQFLSAAREETRLGLVAAQSGADEAALGHLFALVLELKLLVIPARP
jgi:hypothetical protein